LQPNLRVKKKVSLITLLKRRGDVKKSSLKTKKSWIKEKWSALRFGQRVSQEMLKKDKRTYQHCISTSVATLEFV